MKKTTILAVLIIMAVLTACEHRTITGGHDKYWEAAHNAGYATDMTFRGYTPAGVAIYGNKEISDLQKRLIDEGTSEVIEQARAEYGDEIDPRAYTHAMYRYYIPRLECDLSPEQRVPSFLTYGGAEYDGTIYDQYNTKGKHPQAPYPYKVDTDGDGVPDTVSKYLYYNLDGASAIYAAEGVLGFGVVGSSPEQAEIYVCPSDTHLKDAFRYGVEHSLLANGRTSRVLDWFWGTMTHGLRGHPLIPRGEGLAPEPDTPESVLQVKRNAIDGVVTEDGTLVTRGRIIRAVR